VKYINLFIKVIRIIIGSCSNFFSSAEVFYISDRSDWVIRDIGNELASHLTTCNFKITNEYFGIRNSIVHYGSITSFLLSNRLKRAHKSNKIIVTWFHVLDNDPRSNLLYKAISFVDVWHTASQLSKNKMIKLGIPSEKIIVIPLGIDLKKFFPLDSNNKKINRKKLDIPEDSIVIGSFQKDGNGWDQGLEPKLIKGPDIFCDIIEMLAKQYNIFVLLTGPSRGYVKNRLKNAGIKYRHDLLSKASSVANYFQVIDLYLICSREEGGPKALLESLASGVPLVSTKVGMAPEIIQSGENGYVVDIGDRVQLFEAAKKILDS
jgi:glycosyltransferase involved in cell wall biosynthesis